MYSKGALFPQNRPPRLDTKRSSYQQDVSTSLPFHRASPQPHQALPAVGSLCGQPMPLEHWIWEPQRSWKRSAEQIEQKINAISKKKHQSDPASWLYTHRSRVEISYSQNSWRSLQKSVLKLSSPFSRHRMQMLRWPGSLQKEHETWNIIDIMMIDDWFSMVFASNGFSGSTSQFYRAVQQSS